MYFWKEGTSNQWAFVSQHGMLSDSWAFQSNGTFFDCRGFTIMGSGNNELSYTCCGLSQN